MTTQDHEVIDRNGKRVRRNGIIEDGDRIVVKMTMMDAANPDLVAAAALADRIKRSEAFDASNGVGHRPGTLPTYDASASEAARQQRIKNTSDAWKGQPVVMVDRGQLLPQPPAMKTENLSHDHLIEKRDKRLEEAWRY